MSKNKIISIIINVLNEYFKTQEIKGKSTKDTTLLGEKSVLDSMGLVNVIIDIELKFLDEDIEISLTSEEAMSRRNSPFRTVETLADYILEQIGETNE